MVDIKTLVKRLVKFVIKVAHLYCLDTTRWGTGRPCSRPVLDMRDMWVGRAWMSKPSAHPGIGWAQGMLDSPMETNKTILESMLPEKKRPTSIGEPVPYS